MKSKILSVVFGVSFMLTGCGIESLFIEGGTLFTLFCFGVTAISGFFLFGGKEK